MTMTPLTGSDLEHMTDLKDAKDTWKESGDQMHDSMQQMALSVEAMQDGINSLQNGHEFRRERKTDLERRKGTAFWLAMTAPLRQ